MKFLVLGATGMSGHTISIYLLEQGYEVDTLSRKPFSYGNNIVCDVTELGMLENVIAQGNYDYIINCIGSLNQFADNDKANAVFLNSFLPHWLVKVTSALKTRIIHMSTDCVFSGRKGNYAENSFPDGSTFYDRSKALGEINDLKNLTFRNSIVGPDISENGIGLFNWFMKQKGPINGYKKSIWSGVTTLTLAKAMEKAAKDGLVGVYHLTNNENICKYDLLCLFNKYFKNNKLEISCVDGVNLNKSIINTRNDFDFIVPVYEDMIKEMVEWVKTHKKLYPHYFAE
ncbi:MAG: sugar nucleotide-binding protein [Phascolarctobacterium sp.]|uniref:SDR family oxidoreductase n=1 Tax=Phascolarctobacterium sp. TaxID=2049039 RepID=UPI0026DD6C9B|nr:sugar nucleotide-binding protein [Phascolarctobacterium sp.]MDO4921398.1 sugar nucleotide-binding protein [Phascolarctobacterium sp.]